MAKKQLNTACKAIFKDGTTQIYNSIEEASKATSLSETSIRIRCNKSHCNEDILFEWLDEHTKKHYIGKKNKQKGIKYELSIIKDLTKLGFRGLKSSRAESRNLDDSKIDIAETEDTLSCYIQCKATKNIPPISTIMEECNRKDRPLVIFWKKQESSDKIKEFVTMPKEYFYKLLKAYENNQNN